MAQAHWQSSPSSIAQAEIRGSCILDDEVRSDLNALLAQRIRRGDFAHMNILEVDNVCDHGNDILSALRSRFGGASPACAADTGGTCRFLSCSSSRGPTSCSGGHCMCQDGSCAVA